MQSARARTFSIIVLSFSVTAIALYLLNNHSSKNKNLSAEDSKIDVKTKFEQAMQLYQRFETDQAMAIYRDLCKNGHKMSCAEIKWNEGDEDTGRAILSKECETGNLAACELLASWEAGLENFAEDERLLRLACPKIAGACASLSHYVGRNGELDEERRLDKIACDAGALAGCFNLAVAAEGAEKFEEAFQEFHRLCTAGLMAACVEAGSTLEYRGEKEKAVSLYRKACEGADITGCRKLLDLDSSTQTRAAIAPMLAKACEARVAEACEL